MATIITKSKSITWKTIEVDDTAVYKWYQEARFTINNKLVFKFYATVKSDMIYLIDVTNDITYKFSNSLVNKSKAYTLAFKLLKDID